MQSKKSCYQSLRIFDHVLIVLFQNEFEPDELIVTNCFQHVLGVGGVIEERATFASRALLFEALDVSHYYRANQVLGSYALQIFIWCDPVHPPELVEDSG